MSSSTRVLVLGGGFGGLNTALYASRDKTLDVTLISKNKHHVYTPGLKYFLRTPRIDKYRFDIPKLVKNTDIEFINDIVLDVDYNKKTVSIESGELGYDKLVLALGGEVNSYGLDITDIDKFYSWRDALNLKEKAEKASECTLIGGGYVGVELACELSLAGLDVTIVDSNDLPMSGVSKTTGQKTLKYLNKNKISFYGGNRVKKIEDGSFLLEDRREIHSELIVWAGGMQASRTVQRIFGVDEKGVHADRYLKTKYSDIYAIGDCMNRSFNTGFNAYSQSKALANNLNPNKKDIPMDEISSLMVQLGKKGMMIKGDRTLVSRIFNWYKQLEYYYYRVGVKWNSSFQ
ncbi:NAD(P)/FAD-dependent oxidoreductase [Methanonatronarchaeum sp. AMET6-2]|uniref:NAD(P)/FAD-dependent oxidoreductase n=1 Tax=Methanonatronarchaeum sp. AMET6-2 TaxID=2933293 RepID=UPI001FF53D76|nr:FAD-dependent oxidoreductase [Methanonatronarchaeum sp. AMET6-2]UOY09503.1 FAD-dependent oxidoreductase [Methanonatronarchaeum sp. AMET6-2]